MTWRPAWLPSKPEWTPTNAEYHGDLGRWGSTMLKVYRESPALAFRRFIARDLERDPPSTSMILGSLVHTLILEPDLYDTQVVVVPVAGKTAKIFKSKVADNPDKLVVTAPEDSDARFMAESVHKPQTEGARIAHALFFQRPGVAEYSFRWDDDLGVPCKVRFDWLTETRRGAAMVNLKTSRDPSTRGFSRAAFDLDYHCQQAFYERGFQHLAEGLLPDRLLVVIHNAPPWEVSVKQPSAEFMELGRQQIKADLSDLADALKLPERGCWAASWEAGVELVELPPWARLKRRPTVYDAF